MQEDALNATPDRDGFVERAAELRRSFDARFREVSADAPDETIDLLALSVGDREVCLVVSEIAQIVSRPTIVRVPDAAERCLGVLGNQGRLVAVFDLAPELAEPGVKGAPSVVVVARRDTSVGFATGKVLGYHRAARSSLLAPPSGSDASRMGTLVRDRPIVVLSVDELVDRLNPDLGARA